MSEYCPNINTPEFKKMSSVLGNKIATACWVENKGFPIWETSKGEPSPLWNELLSYPGVASEANAMSAKSYLYSTKFQEAKATLELNEHGEPTAKQLMYYRKQEINRGKVMKLYKALNLVDKTDPTKPIKWSKTAGNFKKVSKIVQNINSGQLASATLTNVASEGKLYYTIMLTPKAAFKNEEGKQLAHYDPISGEITISEEGLTAETVIHEFAHPFVDALATHNPELFNNLINDIKKDAKVPEIKKVLDHVAKNYAESGNEIADKELLAYTISEYGKGNINPATGRNTRSALKRFYAWVTSLSADMMKYMRESKTLYVNQIHPKTKYNEVADLFTVYSQVGNIRLASNKATEVKKTSPEEITDTEKKAAKRAKIKAKIAAKKAKGASGDMGAVYKLLNALPADFIELKNEAAHMSSLLPKEISTRLTPGYIKVLSGGKAVVGMFKDSMIHLSSTGPKGTAYHEGFHAVFRTLMDNAEQSIIISEIKALSVDPTDKDIFDIELQLGVTPEEAEKIYYEEILADQFAEYMESPLRDEYPSGILGFFQKLGDWITRIFSRQSAIDKLFSNISTGKYETMTPNVTRGVAYKVHELFNIQEVTRITKELTSVAFKDIKTLDDLKANPASLKTVEDSLLDSYASAEESGNDALVDNIESIFNEDGDGIDVFWLREMDSYLRHTLGLVSKVRKVAEKESTDDVDERNAEDLERNNYIRSSYEVSGKESATVAVKFMVAMIPETVLIDPNKGATLDNTTQKLSPLTGLPMLSDFAMLYNDVENSLAGIVQVSVDGKVRDGVDLMLDRLKEHSKYKPEMFILANKIENATLEIQTQFFGAFSKQKGNFVHTQIRGSAKDKNIRADIFDANFSNKATVIHESWATNFVAEFGMIEDKQRVYNPDKIIKFNEAREALMIQADEEGVAATRGDGKISKDTLRKFRSILNTMGVSISPHTLNYIIESSMPDNSTLSIDAEYAIQTNNLLSDFYKATTDLLSRKGSIYGSANHIYDNKGFFKQKLAEADSYFKTIPGENSFLGPNGNQIYSFQHNDLTSKDINKFKSGDLSRLELLSKSAYAKNSVWINELLDEVNGESNREDFSLYMYGNLRSEETAGDKGAKASELKPIDAYMDNVNKTLSGYYIGLAEADKSRQTYFKGPKFRRSGLTLNQEGKPVIVNKEGTQILKGYLADELSRMRIAHSVVTETEESPAVPEHKWVLHYHYHQVKPGEGSLGVLKDKIPGNAFESYLFPDIKESGKLQGLGLLDADGNVLALSPTNFDNNKAIDKYIQNAFYSLVLDEMKVAAKLGLLKEETAGELVPNLISSSIINDKKRGYTQGGAVDTLQIMGDYVLNSMIGSIEQTKMFNCDPAVYKTKTTKRTKTGELIITPWSKVDHYGDFKKRIPAIYASGTDFRIFNNPDGTPVVRPHYTSATIANIEVPSSFFGERNEDGDVIFNKENMKEVQAITKLPMGELEKLFEPYLGINQTDAQAWITLDAYKERMQGVGQWTPAHEVAFEEANSGVNMSPKNIKLLAQPLKTVHSETIPTENGEMIMHYNKQSEAPLFPFMRTMELGRLMKAMERDGIDHVIVLDGKKAGASGIVDITDGQGNIKEAKDIKMNYTPLSYNNLFLQQDLRSKQVKPSLFGSQVTKNVLVTLNLDEKYFNDLTGQEVFNLHHETIGRLSDKGLVSLDKSLDFDPETKTYGFEREVGKKSHVHALVRKEFEGEISENLIEAIEDGTPFDALPISTKIMNKLMALTTKKTVRLKQQGASLIQLSDLGFIGSEQKLSDKVKNGIIWFKDPTKRLKPMSVEGGEVKAAQILMPHSKIVEILGGSSKKALSAQAAMMEKFGTTEYKELSSTQLKSLMESEILEGLSYRIPNQGPSSNDAFEIVGILPPEMGDTMVAFSDITTKTGSDFDIDKSFVVLPNFYFDEQRGKIRKTGYDLSSLDTNSQSSLENLRLDLMREMLMHPSAYASVMAPLDDPWLEKFAKGLFPEKTALKPMEFFTGNYQLNTKQVFDGAKSLVGTIANHMTHHSAALADGLQFNGYFLGKGVKVEGHSLLSNKFDEDGNEVAGTLGAYMNAIVDAAKDPFIVRANVNQHTAGVTFMLARAGVSREWITSFIGQPVLVDLMRAKEDMEKGPGNSRFAKDVVVDGRYLTPLEVVMSKYGIHPDVKEHEFRVEYPKMRDNKQVAISTTTGDLINLINKPDLESTKFKEEQVKILNQFLEWQKESSHLNDVIKVSKADVEGATKNIMTAKLAVNLVHKVLDTKKIGNADKMLGIYMTPDGELDIPNRENSRMVGRYFNNSVLAAIDRYSRFFIVGSHAADQMVTNVAHHAGYTELTSSPHVEKLVDTVSTEIFTLAATDTRVFNKTPEELHDKLYGKGKTAPGSNSSLSMAARIEASKHTELKDNLLINALQFKAGRDGAPDKIILPNSETVKETKEALAHAWEEIMAVSPELGEDLITYSFYTTGFGASYGSFAEHIPTKYLSAMGFSEDIKAKNVAFNEPGAMGTSDMDKIFKNLYKNNQLVPKVHDSTLKNMEWVSGGNLLVSIDDGFILTEGDHPSFVIGDGAMGGKIFKRFVKRESYVVNEKDEVTGTEHKLYKLMKYTPAGNAVYLRTNMLGISGYGNNVKEYIGDGKTSIFKENNVSLPKGLAEAVSKLEEKGSAVDPDVLRSAINYKESEIEDRLAFCIMIK